MDAATFVAALIGPLYVVVGIGILLDPDHYRRITEDFFRSPALIYLGGAMALAAGLAILYFHHSWSDGWRVIITVLGWLAVLKGAHLLILPGHVSQLWSPLISRPTWLRPASIAIIAFGLFLSFAAYGGV